LSASFVPVEPAVDAVDDPDFGLSGELFAVAEAPM